MAVDDIFTKIGQVADILVDVGDVVVVAVESKDLEYT